MTTINLGRLKFVWKGVWAGSTSYDKDDVVRYGFHSYICINAHTSSASFPADSANWESMVLGADGALQSGDNISALTNDSGYLTDITGQSIENLSDVASMTPSEGQALVYSSGSWSAADMAAGGEFTLSSDGGTIYSSNSSTGGVKGGAGNFYVGTNAGFNAGVYKLDTANYTSGSGYTPNQFINDTTLVLVSGTAPSVYPQASIQTDSSGSVNHVSTWWEQEGGDETTVLTLDSAVWGSGTGFTIGIRDIPPDHNIFIGDSAGYSVTTGYNNIAIGHQALYNNTNSRKNTAIGHRALYNNNWGDNTIIGYEAAYSSTIGDQNTGIGYQALYNNTTGVWNTAIGYQALYNNTTGYTNTAIGYRALRNNTTGAGNFGASFLDNGGVYTPVFDPTTESNRVVMGHTSVTNAYIQVAWTVVSDARDKTQIAPVPHGLDFVNQLNPVEFKFRVSRDSEETNGNKRYGFLAQEVLSVEGADNVIVDTEDPEKLKMTNEELIPVMVKAMQEMSAKITALEAEIVTLKGN